MKLYPIIRIVFASFLMVIAFPYILEAGSTLQLTFWGVWTLFFLFIVGGNLATLLQLTDAPVMEQVTDPSVEQPKRKKLRIR